MTRLLFPQDRLVYAFTGYGQPITIPSPTPIVVYVDQACTILADIRNLDGTPIPGSVVTTGRDSLIPQFLGPDGPHRLWGKGPDGSAQPLDAVYGDWLAALLATTSTITYTLVQSAPASQWHFTNPTGRFCNVTVYVGGQIWLADTTVTSSTIDVVFASPTTGTLVVN